MISQTIIDFFNELEASRILVIGDVMLDTYIKGNSTRISPEAPVPVITGSYEEYKLGGAGNVVANLVDYAEHIDVIGCYGKDESYDHIRSLFANHDNINNVPVFPSSLGTEIAHFRTTNKTRVVANEKHICRIDEETILNGHKETHVALLDRFTECIQHGPQVVVLSDYGKGVLTEELISNIVEYCKAADIPVIVDPKDVDPIKYRSVPYIKPNRIEFELLIGNVQKTLGDLSEEILAYKDKYHHDTVFVTLGDCGVAYNIGNKVAYVPAVNTEVVDVVGAGDTVLAVLALGIAAERDMCQVGKAANWVASIAVSKSGTWALKKGVIGQLLSGD